MNDASTLVLTLSIKIQNTHLKDYTDLRLL